tara:strand:+ start:675 stop:794 length:120 start_codon:yes stop_codon:yes gene_type:complete
MKWFLWANIMGILLGWMLTLFVMMFDDPRRVSGRKRGKK